MWTIVKCGYDVEDETANFGTRAVAVGCDGLFETNTIATIESDSQDEHSESEPDIKSALHPQLGLIIAINNSLIVFNKECSQVKSMVAFENIIDCFYVSKNGSFMFIGLSDGLFQCFSIRTGQVLFTSKFPEPAEEGKTYVSIFNCATDSAETLLIFFSSGAVYRLSGFVLPSNSHKESLFNGTTYSISNVNDTDISNGSQFISHSKLNISGVEEEDIFTSISIEKVEQLEFNVLSVFQIIEDSRNRFVACDHSTYASFSLEDEDIVPVCLEADLDIKKIALLKQRFIVTLSTTKELIVICPFTMIPIYVWNERKVKDFALFGDTDQDMIVLTEEDVPCLLMLTIPGFQVKLQFQIEEAGFLIDRISTIDEFLFLEKLKDVDLIHVKTVVESMPEFRLDRLLKRGKFDRAEQFARDFNLQMELVYKAKLRKLLQDLQPWTESEVPKEENFSQAVQLLKEIQDVEFIAEFTFNAVLAESVMFHYLLTYAKKRLQEHLLKDAEGENVRELLSKMSAYSIRFDTFLLLDLENQGVEDWLNFSKADLLKQCLHYVKQGDLQKSRIIWSRHLHEMSSQLNEYKAYELFNAIPDTVLIVNAVPWLQQVLPYVLDKFPNILTEFIDWFLTKIWELEKRKPEDWPAIGVQYSELLLLLIRNPQNLVASEMKEYFWHSSTINSPIKKLIKKIKTLKEINDLYQNYKIYITTTEYFHDSAEEVVFILLNRVPLDKCSNLVNIFLDKYFLENQLIRDKIIAHFIKMEIEHSLQWWKCEDNMKEMKIIKLIHCISGTEEKVSCLVCLLTNASIPWSPIVTELADKFLHLYKNNADSVKECYRMVPLKEILKKYSIHSVLTTKRELTKCVRYIFKEDLDSKLEDALQLVKGHESDLTMYPYFLHIEELIKSKKYEEVSQFLLGKLSNENLLAECCIFIKAKFSIHFSAEYFEALDEIIKVLKIVQKKWNKKNKTGVDNLSLFIKKATVCKSIYILKRDYKIEVTETILLEKNSCKSIVRNSYSKIMKDVDKKEESLNTFKNEVCKIAGLLNLSFEDVILYLTECALSFKDFDLAILISSFIMNNNPELSLKTSLLAVQLSSKLMNYQASLPHPKFASAIPVVKSLVTLGIISCDVFMLNEALEIYTKSVLLNEFCSSSSATEILSTGLSHLYWDPVASLASAPYAATFILSLFSYCHSIQGPISAHGSSLHSSQLDRSLTSKKPEVNLSHVSGFRQIVQRFFGEQQDIKSIKMVCTILWQCASSVAASCTSAKNPLLGNVSIVHSCVSALLKKVLGAKHLDLHLAQFLLHYFSPPTAVRWLLDQTRNAGNDCHRLSHISLVGLEYCKKNSFVTEQKVFYKTYLQCTWSKRLLEFNLTIRDTFKQTEKEQKQLLAKLITLPDITVQILIEYCGDFGFDVQDYLLRYLRFLLLSWEPEFVVETDPIGNKKMVVKNSTENLYERCTEIATFLENSEELKSVLNLDLWNEVNQYNYEVYQVIVDLLEFINHETEYFRKFKLILFFLMSYQRICEPSTLEEEFWEGKFASSQNFPAIAAYRLPVQFVASSWFNSNADVWKVVRPELNIQSYKQWFDVMSVLGIEKNSICTLAINQTVIEDGNHTDMQWCIHKKYVQLLKDVKECVEYVTNLEMASASLYHVVSHLPPGADQLTAAELCLMQTKQWHETQPSQTSQSCLNRVEKKYLTISTMHVLYTNKLAKPEFLNLVLDPHELIKELYHDSSIIERITNHALDDIDINNAVVLIAKLHSVNLTNIRLQLLSTWLQPNNVIQEQSFNETMIFSPNETSVSSVDENFIRACYILESDIETSIRYLVGLIFANDLDDLKPVSVQFRALKCLCAIIPSPESLEEETGRDIESIQSHIQSLMYLNELEKCGLVYSIEGFQSCNKEELVESLMSQKTHHSMKVAIKLCQDYDISNHSIWKDIVSHLVKYLMIDELKIVLPYLNGMFEFTNFHEIINAWNVLLLYLLEKIDPNDLSLIEEFQILLNSCCVFPLLDIEAIKSHCYRINAMHVLSVVASLTSEFNVSNKNAKFIHENGDLNGDLKTDNSEFELKNSDSFYC